MSTGQVQALLAVVRASDRDSELVPYLPAARIERASLYAMALHYSRCTICGGLLRNPDHRLPTGCTNRDGFVNQR